MKVIALITTTSFLFLVISAFFPSTACAFELTGPVVDARSEILASNQEDNTSSAQGYRSCYADGVERARTTHGAGGWMLGGLALGFALGLIGTLVIYSAASGGEIEVPPAEYEQLEGDCRDGFFDGYKKQVKSNKKKSALAGGIVGTVIIVAVVLANAE